MAHQGRPLATEKGRVQINKEDLSTEYRRYVYLAGIIKH